MRDRGLLFVPAYTQGLYVFSFVSLVFNVIFVRLVFFFFRYFNSWVVRASGNLIPLRGGMQRYSALGSKPFPLMYYF